MVLGGMVLLYKGTITLKDSNPDEAIKIEFKHMINVTTRYPALALFLIGLVFTVVALYFVEHKPLPPFTIDGKLHADQPELATVIISFPVYYGTPDSDGRIKRVVHPVMDNIAYQVVIPGSDAIIGSLPQNDMKDGVLTIGTISPATKIPKPRAGEITAAPPLPSLDQGGKF